MSKLRWYQEEAVASIFNYFAQGGKGNPVIAMPTGTGKSHIIGGFVQQTLQYWPRQRFMMLTHVKELIQQNANKLLEAWPEAPLGIYSAGLKQKDTMMPITFGGVASVYQNEELFGHIDVLIIDEAHLLSPKSGSMYQAVIAKLKAVNPYLIVVGLTATAFRLGQGLITDEGLFTDIVCDFTKLDKFNQLVQEGWISLLIPRQTATTIDVDGVGIQNGEFAQGALQDAVDKKEITYEACKEMCRNGGNRKSWLVFCSGVEHSEHVAEVLTGLGVHSAPVHSKLKDGERDDYIRRFKAGELRCLTNNNVLTTGFDHPPIDLIGMIRPTLSPGLWVQMLGRGSRPSRETDKHNCIAEGQKVLTDFGLVRIEQVTKAMRVWDGIEFVKHDGVVDQGEREVIEYVGLIATPDHEVYTAQGRQTFRKCQLQQIAIRVTGNGSDAISITESRFTLDNAKRQEQSSLRQNSMRSMWQSIRNRIYKFNPWQSILSAVRQSTSSSEMALCSLSSGSVALSASWQQTFCRLWWTRYQIYVRQSERYGTLYNIVTKLCQIVTVRSYRQQRSLREEQFTVGNTHAKHEQSAFIKRRVYDIVNAGRRNRFTVNGLLVSNCLVLDFAGNTVRLGPINDPVIPKKKGKGTGEVPVKICDHCGTYNHISVRFCVSCGAEFQFEVKITPEAAEAELIRSTFPIVESYSVTSVIYRKHMKAGRPPSLRVSYICGMQMFNEWIMLEDDPTTFPAKKARNWWRQRAMPPVNEWDTSGLTVDYALQYTQYLAQPKRIRVHVNKKWPEVVAHEF